MRDTLKETTEQIVGFAVFGVVRERFSDSTNRIVTRNLRIVCGGINELCLWSNVLSKLQQFGREVYACYFKSGVCECAFVKTPAPQPMSTYSSQVGIGTLQSADNLVCSALR